MVGLIPLFAVETLEPAQLAKVPAFARRLEWFIDHRPDLTAGVACMRTPGTGGPAAVQHRQPATAAARSSSGCSTRRSSSRPYGIRCVSA